MTGKEGENVTISSLDLPAKPTLHFKANKNCTFHVTEGTSLVKVLLEDCHDCTFVVNGSIITSTMEIWSSQRCNVHLDVKIGTMQVSSWAGSAPSSGVLFGSASVFSGRVLRGFICMRFIARLTCVGSSRSPAKPKSSWRAWYKQVCLTSHCSTGTKNTRRDCNTCVSCIVIRYARVWESRFVG